MTRLLGRCESIFYYNCERFLFVYIVKLKQNTNFAGCIKKKNPEMLKIFKNRIFLGSHFKKFDHPWGHVRHHKKFGRDWFSRFDVYWIQTVKQNLEM